MERILKIGVVVVLLGVIGIATGAAELPKVLILNAPGTGRLPTFADQIVQDLADAGFADGQQIDVTIAQPESSEAGVELATTINPAVIIEIGTVNRVDTLLHHGTIPIISSAAAERYVDAQGVPVANITGTYTLLDDIVYNSYKFLNKIAPLKPGQQVVFLENTKLDLISQDMVADALERLNIPLKAVVDIGFFEDCQQAILRYNTDPDVSWILMGVWPLVHKDGTPVDRESEAAVWLRENLKKPSVGYWEFYARMGGVPAAFAVDLPESMSQISELAVRVLQGENIHDIKPVYPRKVNITLNRKTATNMGLIFPMDVLKLADVIYDDYEGKQVIRK